MLLDTTWKNSRFNRFPRSYKDVCAYKKISYYGVTSPNTIYVDPISHRETSRNGSSSCPRLPGELAKAVVSGHSPVHLISKKPLIDACADKGHFKTFDRPCRNGFDYGR